jgi:hypothetical protein
MTRKRRSARPEREPTPNVAGVAWASSAELHPLDWLVPGAIHPCQDGPGRLPAACYGRLPRMTGGP